MYCGLLVGVSERGEDIEGMRYRSNNSDVVGVRVAGVGVAGFVLDGVGISGVSGFGVYGVGIYAGAAHCALVVVEGEVGEEGVGVGRGVGWLGGVVVVVDVGELRLLPPTLSQSVSQHSASVPSSEPTDRAKSSV